MLQQTGVIPIYLCGWRSAVHTRHAGSNGEAQQLCDELPG